MKKLAIALVALAGIGFAAPAFAHDAGNGAHLRVAQADVRVKVNTGRHGHVAKRVIVRRDRDRHRGWRHHHHRSNTVTIIKKRHHHR